MEKYVMLMKSCVGSACLAYEENLINEIDLNNYSRSVRFNDAIEKAKSLSDGAWEELLSELNELKRKLPSDIDVPQSFKVKVEDDMEESFHEVEKNLKRALKLSRPRTRFLIEILFLHYLNCLKKDTMIVGDKEILSDLTGPEMAKILFEILLLDREQDKDTIQNMKELLFKWRNNNDT